MPYSLFGGNFRFQNYKSFTKGRIEWLIPKVYNEKTPIINTAFEISEAVLQELEKNLIYKTSDRMHFIAFGNFNDYHEYLKNRDDLRHQTTTFNEDKIEGQVYECILLTGNHIDIEYQIRRGIARQFLHEFLLGFTYRSRFEPAETQKTPQWLINGFIEYFAGGISREDFLQFKSKINTPAFRNLNFIDLENQELFGKVLWYFFEKEKGRNLNSVFWMLVKYADNFENLFDYHFGLSFRNWLNLRFEELNKINPVISNTSDFSIEIKNKESRWAKFKFNNKAKTAIISLSNSIDESHYLWNIQLGNRLLTHKSINNYKMPFPTFQKCSWAYHDKMNEWIHIDFNEGWVIVLKNAKIKLPLASVYRLIEADNDILTLIQENPGKTALIYYSISKQSPLKTVPLEANGKKIDEFARNKDSNVYFFTQIKRFENHYKSGIYKLVIQGQSLKTELLHESEHGKTELAFKNLIIESSEKISFIKNSVLEDAIYHINLNSPTENTVKTSTKGLSYQQQWIFNSEQFAEFYIARNRWNINIIDLSAPVFDRDTFIKPVLSFDSVTINTDSSRPNKVYLGAKFTSPYKRKNFHRLIKTATSNKPKPWQKSDFQPWFYIHRSHFQLSNADFKLPYDGLVSPLEQYNSPLTFFYGNTLMDVVNKHRLDLNLFSNINRRRIGFQLQHTYRSSNDYVHNSELTYRLRQFAQSNGTNYRNRSTWFAYHLGFPFMHSKFTTGLTVLNSQIISINNSKEKVGTPTLSKTHFQIPIGWNTSSNSSNYKSKKIDYQLLNTLLLGLISGEQTQIPTVSIKSQFHAKGRVSMFNWKTNLTAIYSFSKENTSYMLGGSNGWISSSANSNSLYNSLRDYQLQFLMGGFDIRGLPLGVRIGNSLIHIKSDWGLPLLRLFPNSLKERIFWKSMVLYAFYDVGLAFYGESPSHYSNPYNTVTINTPNFTLTASTRQNPWVSGTGFGIQVNLVGYPIRIEYANGQMGALKTAPRLLLSLGKNF